MRERIIEIAKSFVGIKEIPGNMGWEDKRFEELMEDCGWQKGQAWCSYFCELVWKLAFLETEVYPSLDKLFSAGAVKTYNNFKESCLFEMSKKPDKGAIVVWQTWKKNLPQWTGHAGIVSEYKNGNEIETIEGNTNKNGKREGMEVAYRRRILTMDARNGLVMRGFIHPILLI